MIALNNVVLGFEETLEDLISMGRCFGCGACIALCPYGILELKQVPKLIDECLKCGNCANVCPSYELNLDEIEKQFFGRARRTEEMLGVYRSILIARSTNQTTLKLCQDGGVVTTLLRAQIEDKLIDGAIASGLDREKPLYPIPKLLISQKEACECVGSRYTYTENMLDLLGAVELLGTLESMRFAFVGLPCQIQAARKIQMLPIPLLKWSEALSYTIGLFCSETYNYSDLTDKIIGGVGIEPSEVVKINVKGKMLITTANGETKNVSLKTLKPFVRSECKSCTDFTAEVADISVGGIGLNGWNIIIIRSDRGEKLLDYAEEKRLLEIKPIEQEVFSKLTKQNARKKKSAFHKNT